MSAALTLLAERTETAGDDLAGLGPAVCWRCRGQHARDESCWWETVERLREGLIRFTRADGSTVEVEKVSWSRLQTWPTVTLTDKEIDIAWRWLDGDAPTEIEGM